MKTILKTKTLALGLWLTTLSTLSAQQDSSSTPRQEPKITTENTLMIEAAWAGTVERNAAVAPRLYWYGKPTITVGAFVLPRLMVGVKGDYRPSRYTSTDGITTTTVRRQATSLSLIARYYIGKRGLLDIGVSGGIMYNRAIEVKKSIHKSYSSIYGIAMGVNPILYASTDLILALRIQLGLTDDSRLQNNCLLGLGFYF